jgi:hypothetical protein
LLIFICRLEEALEIIREKRPGIDPNLGFIGQLQRLEEHLYSLEHDRGVDTLNISGI